MKLKYICLAIIGAATMGACSGDEIPTPNPNGEEAMVTLSMGVDNVAIITKADPMEDLNGLAGEADINRLTIFLFKADGSLAAKKDTLDVKETPTNTPLNRIGNVIVPAGTYDILIVANADNDIMNIANKGQLEAYQGKLSSQLNLDQSGGYYTSKNMLMVSKYYEGVELKSLTSGGEPLRLTYNYFGEKSAAKNIEASETPRTTEWYTDGTAAVPLTRQAARIQVKSVKIAFKEDLVGGKFILDSIYLVNIRPTTHLVPTSGSFEAVPAAAPLYYRGAPATVNVVSNLIYPGANAIKNSFHNEYSFPAIADGATYSDSKLPYWYAFENQTSPEVVNSIYNTRLVIAGRITTPGNVTLPESYYSILIRDTEVSKLVERNKIYQVAVIIGGLGSDNPDKETDNAMITATVTAEPWKVVIHEEDITD